MVDLSERGLRNPRHGFAVVHQSRRLQPFFCAPVRPMETIVGYRLRADAMLTQLANIPFMPPMEVELAVWKVAISQLDDYFTDLFVADSEDDARIGDDPRTVHGSGVRHAGTPVSSQGPRSQSALHTRTRHWAGESGSTSAAATFEDPKAFVPYVSAAAFHVARMYYEMEMEVTEATRTDDDLWQQPPLVSDIIRGMTYSRIGATPGHSGEVPTASVAEWAERLSLLSRPNRTYREYLKGFGVSDSRIASMPEPLMVLRRSLRPSDPMVVGGVVGGVGDQTGNEPIVDTVGRFGSSVVPLGTTFRLGGASNFGSFSARFDETRQRRYMVDEPSIVIGLCKFDIMPIYGSRGRAASAHVMDITRLVSGSLWGDAMADEIDFITHQEIPGPSSMGTIAGRPNSPETILSAVNLDGVNAPFIMNALNLFLNGDHFTNDPVAFGPYQIGANVQAQFADNQSPSAYMSEQLGELMCVTSGEFRMGVATDLVQ